MSWLRIDDELFLHPKWIATPPLSRALWITALSYAGKFATGGAIHTALLPMLGGSVDDAEALVASGLWETTESGYQIHDFENYNASSTPSAKAHLSEVRSEAGKRGGQRSGESRAQANGKQIPSKTKQIQAPEPVPVPVPRVSPTSKHGGIPSGREESGTLADNAPRAAADLPLSVYVENALQAADADPKRKHWRGALVAKIEAACPAHPNAYAKRLVDEWHRGVDLPPPPSGVPKNGRRLTASEQRAADVRTSATEEFDEFCRQLDDATPHLSPSRFATAPGATA